MPGHCVKAEFAVWKSLSCTAAAKDAIKKVAEEVPEMLVGAGTVIGAGQVEDAVEAGAKFIVSPGLSEEVVKKCQELVVICLPGCVTASEIMKAKSLGIGVVKFFPAQTSGGIKAIKALAAPFGDMKFIPTGGINTENIGTYLENPFIAACGGSWMVKESDINAGNFEEITQKATGGFDTGKEVWQMSEIFTRGTHGSIYRRKARHLQ